MKKIKVFIKREAVLCAALFLAVLSAFGTPPDRAYAGYIDYRTLAILFCLMCVMAGLQKTGVFFGVAKKLLQRVKGSVGLVLFLVLICFFSSMLITNDVALLTFVPFTFTVLDLLGEKVRRRLCLPVVAMQTIAANLGSMLTPIGNPQNLYLYGKAQMAAGDLLALMLPYTLFSLALLTVWGVVLGKKNRTMGPNAWEGNQAFLGQGQIQLAEGAGRDLAVYLLLFVFCLLAVGRVLAWQVVLVVVAVAVWATDRKVFARVDYSLLLTFVGFFVFIGNVGRIPAFRGFLQEAVGGREVYTAILASQAISNVPAALLLSGFTQNYEGLLVGANLGGLGTLIASMASLISYKYVAKAEETRKGAYIRIFTTGNLCFLAALIGLYEIWKRI